MATHLDPVANAISSISTSKLSHLARLLTGEPDPILAALHLCIVAEIAHRNHEGPPAAFQLPPDLDARALLIAGNIAVGTAEFLSDEQARMLFTSLAALCAEAAEAKRCASAGPAN